MTKKCIEENNLKRTISVENSAINAVFKAIPIQVIAKYESLGIDISDLQVLGRNALLHFVRNPPTDEQVILLSNSSAGSKNLEKMIQLGVKNAQ